MITCKCYQHSKTGPYGLIPHSSRYRNEMIEEHGHLAFCPSAGNLSQAGDPFNSPEVPNYAGDPFHAREYHGARRYLANLQNTVSQYDCDCYKRTCASFLAAVRLRRVLIRNNGHKWNCKFFQGVR